MDIQPSYSAADFAQLIEQETNTVELKSGVGTKAIADAMTALSNTEGGVIFVGVSDGREVRGKRLDQGTADGIHQAAQTVTDVGAYDIYEVHVDGVPVVAVVVHPRREGWSTTPDGRVLVRRGGRKEALVGRPLLEFLRARALERAESVPLETSWTEAAAPEVVAELRRAFGWQATGSEELTPRLDEQGLATSDGALTIAGALVLTDPQVTLGHAKAVVEVRRHRTGEGGYDRRERFGGPVQDQIRHAHELVIAELGVEMVVTGLYRHELPRLPSDVVREAITNAVAHRDYERDREAVIIEIRPDLVRITSPGGLPDGVHVDALRAANRPRNPNVINVLRMLQLAEDAGLGIDLIEDSMAEAMLDPPRFAEEDGSVIVELPLSGPTTSRERAWVMDLEQQGLTHPGDRVLIVHAARGEALTNRRVREILGVDSDTARAACQRMVDAGLLVQHGERGGTTYTIAEGIAPQARYRMSREDLEALVIDRATESAVTNSDVRELTGLSRPQTLRLLQKLVDDGRLVMQGQRRTARYRTP